MRLIDADEATRISLEHSEKRLLAIDTARTVEAIPVDFINNLITDPNNAGSKSRVLSWLKRE